MDSTTTIGELFGAKIQFCVPNYQRAYAWQVDSGVNIQVAQFLRDIIEHNPSRRYYLGHFLFSKVDTFRYEVIDGQQRLTTVVIFMSCVISECRRRGISKIGDIEVDELVETYLKHRIQKFMTVAEDRSFFEDRIVLMNEKAIRKTNRSSEVRIQEAAKYFMKELKKCKDAELQRWYLTIHTAHITTFVVEGSSAKEVATQIFAFQNDRGKKLTNLEIVKAFLMNQVYQHSEDAEGYIPPIESAFAAIYSQSELVKTPEDTILNWHCQAFLPASADTAVEVIKGVLSSSKEKDRWAVNFSTQLAKTFNFIIDVEKNEERYSGYIADLCYLDKADSMPLLIKLHHIGVLEDQKKSDMVLRMIEAILFKMTFTTGRYRTNDLIRFARELSKENFDSEFMPRLTYATQYGFKSYWDFNGDCLRYFKENTSHYDSDIKYVLYKYENWLRDRANPRQQHLSIDECRAVFREKRLENTLDHITPQEPNFTKYSEEFVNNWLSNIGNLSLLTWSGNSSKSNNNPVDPDVREKFNQVFLAQKEIYDVLCKGTWGEKEISDRRDRIVEFVKEQWGL